MQSQWIHPTQPTFVDHPAHARLGVHPIPKRLHVVTSMFNPLQWRSRYANYWAFAKHVQDAGAVLSTVEVALADRPFEVTEAGNPQHLQLRTDSELWFKENALSLLIQRLPPDAEAVAWIDADILFTRSDWAQACLLALGHYSFIQCFAHAQDLGPNYEPLGPPAESFAHFYWANLPLPHDPLPAELALGGCAYSDRLGPTRGAPSWHKAHPGFAWAARRDALEAVGGLIDFAIIGSADYLMATALLGQVDRALAPGLGQRYVEKCHLWQARAERHIQRNIGYVDGLVLHHYHGAKADRLYNKRWKFLVETEFDPETDLKRDAQGLWQLVVETPRQVRLRDGLRQYARLRNEDR